MPDLVMIGMSHKTSPVDVRERLAFRAEDVPRALRQLVATDGVREGLILSTCNRVEIYAAMKSARPEALWGFLDAFHGAGAGPGPAYYEKRQIEAVAHLCRVASGLDSLVLGEPEVFGQVKDAYRRAQEAETVGEYFRVLFPLAFTLVKRVRTQSGLGRNSVSVSGAAVQMAREVFGRLAGRRVLVLGAGEMGEQVVRSLKNEGAAEVLVSNRTFFRAVRLAEDIGGTPIMLHEAADYLAKVDILISSLGVPEFVLTADEAARSLRGRDRPLLVIDISVPRSVDPAVQRVEGVRLCNIDDLTAIADANTEARRAQAAVAERIIAERAAGILAKCETEELRRAFRAIRFEAEHIRQERLEGAIPRLRVSDEDKVVIDSLTRQIVSGVLQCTLTRLQGSSARSDEGARS